MKRPAPCPAPIRHQPRSDSADSGRGSARLLWVLMAALVAVSLPGCRGCLPEDPLARLKREEEAEKKKREKPKPDFEVARPQMLPFDSGTLQQQFVKHGHWMMAVQPMKANNFDFQAEVESSCARTSGEPIDIPNTAFRLQTSRPAVLPKGQQKLLETTHYLVPPPRLQDTLSATPRVTLETRLRARRGGREVSFGREPTTAMPPYQYFLVVLSDNADRYGYLKLLPSVAPPVEDDQNQLLDNVIHYRVLLPKIDGYAPVPSQPLCWTSIAYVVWDGLNPNQLTPPQQQAMLDWLHWGGQLLISGPNSLDLMRGTFLEEHLPAWSGPAISLGPERFTELNQGWAVAGGSPGERVTLEILPDRPLVGVELESRPGATEVDSTGGLVMERMVGSGRIVVTAFSLADRRILNWGGFDSFFNGALLRRPHRQFSLNPESQSPQVDWVDYRGRLPQLDPNFVTQLRYFTRDVSPATLAGPASAPSSGSQDVASWSDSSGAAEAARTSLRDAAGISIPKAGFVLRVLAVYLIVLVPVNWIVFRAIGRVEWAWIAALVVAVGGAVAVVRLAQLDIGFARSRTELAVLEIQSGYPRGHLTRYTALYTSLSTGYGLHFEDDSAVALPFPTSVPWTRNPLEAVQTVSLRRERELVLSGFQVASNSTGMVHSEQMLDVGGSLDLLGDERQGWAIRNATEVVLKDVGILRRNLDRQYELAWVGELEPGVSRPLAFSLAADQNKPFFTQWQDALTVYAYERQQTDLLSRLDGDNDRFLTRQEVQAEPSLEAEFSDADANADGRIDQNELYRWCITSRQGELTLGRMMELACGPWALRPGGVRLIGWTDQEFQGLTIRPRASQLMLRTMVLAHLRQGPLPPARRDENLKATFDRAEPTPLDETGFDDPLNGLDVPLREMP